MLRPGADLVLIEVMMFVNYYKLYLTSGRRAPSGNLFIYFVSKKYYPTLLHRRLQLIRGRYHSYSLAERPSITALISWATRSAAALGEAASLMGRPITK